MSAIFTPATEAARDDLVTFLGRALQLGDQGVRLTGFGNVATVTVPVTASAGLFDMGATILGMRIVRLQEPGSFDAVVPLAQTLNALQDGANLDVPAAHTLPAWASVTAPRDGWEAAGETDAQVVRAAANEANKAVQAALPESAGEAVLRRIRRGVWAESVHALPTLTRGSAVALEQLGFLQGQDPVRVFRAGGWVRASTRFGEVLER